MTENSENGGKIALEFLKKMDQALVIVDADLCIAFYNAKFADLYGPEAVKSARNLSHLLTRMATCDAVRAAALPHYIEERIRFVRTGQTCRWDVRRGIGVMLRAQGEPLDGAGYAFTFSEITENHLIAQSLKRANRATLLALAGLAEHRDPDTGDHVQRVSRLCYEIGRALRDLGYFPDKLTDEYLDGLALASILHDVGKVAIPDTILFKPGRLDGGERAIMETHTVCGSQVLAKANALLIGNTYFDLAKSIAHYHHERFDGTGYPDRLKGDDIPLEARIVAVADVYDALISDRPYKQAWSEDKAVGLLEESAGSHFDPRIIKAFLRVREWRSQAPMLSWDPIMSVNDESIDEDHRVLIGLVNQLALAGNQPDTLTLELVLDELTSYTLMHFEREEAFMARIGYPDRVRHAAIHQALTDQVVGLIKRFQRDGVASLGPDIVSFLSNWLSNHILGEDKKIGDWVVSRSTSAVLAAERYEIDRR